jgi:alpha-galactosidase
MFWDEDRVRAHNVWRQLLLDHYSPRRHGEVVQVPMGMGTQWHTAEQNIGLVNWYAEHGLPIEYLWNDLGWQRAPATEEEAREHLADDVVDEKKFPNGIQEVSDAVHEHGMKYLLWFGGDEKCRFQAIYPYLDRVRKYRPELLSDEHPGNDNGNPMINNWMIQHYGDRIADLGIDIFRWDSRSQPPPDSSDDRRGINWARTVQGFYEFWDALLERFPDLLIDCCGGGAVNMDLETIQRAVFMHRCDYQCGGIHESDRAFNPKGLQAQTHGISFWAPLTTGSTRQLDTYAIRSAYSPGLHAPMGTLVDLFYLDPPEPPSAEEFDVALLRKLLHEYMSLRHCFYGDYYPLTRYSLEDDAWIAWQFDRPDLEEGIVQAFRRSESDIVASEYTLHGLDRDATYELTNLDLPEITTMTGTELMNKGLMVTIPDRRAAIVIRYRKVS